MKRMKTEKVRSNYTFNLWR